MKQHPRHLDEYKKQLKKGHVQKAYKQILDFLSSFRLHLEKNHTHLSLSNSVQNYYLEVSYFFILTEKLKKEKLKIVLFFYHESFTFDVWLSGNNKAVRKKFVEKIPAKTLKKFTSKISEDDVFSIVRHTLVSDADFKDSDALNITLEKGLLKFTADVENILPI